MSSVCVKLIKRVFWGLVWKEVSGMSFQRIVVHSNLTRVIIHFLCPGSFLTKAKTKGWFTNVQKFAWALISRMRNNVYASRKILKKVITVTFSIGFMNETFTRDFIQWLTGNNVLLCWFNFNVNCNKTCMFWSRVRICLTFLCSMQMHIVLKPQVSVLSKYSAVYNGSMENVKLWVYWLAAGEWQVGKLQLCINSIASKALTSSGTRQAWKLRLIWLCRSTSAYCTWSVPKTAKKDGRTKGYI